MSSSHALKLTATAANIRNMGTKESTKELGDQQTWDDLEVLFQEQAKGLIDIAITINNVGNLIKSTEKLSSDGELITTFNGLAKDIDAFSTKLDQIHNAHKNKKGDVDKDIDHALIMTIFVEYSEYTNRFQNTLVYPLMILEERTLSIKNAPVEGTTNV